MVDNRSTGIFGPSGFTFKSGDISGTAAKTSDEKMGQGNEYYQFEQGEEEAPRREEYFVDRSAQLRASLNSLALINVAGVLREQKIARDKKESSKKEKKEYEENEEES